MSFDNSKKRTGKIKIKGDDLKLINIYSYSVGHVINDVTCSLWFNFTLYFLTDIVSIPNRSAGLVLLIGQIADAICTPIIGILSDNFESKKIGKRTPFYIGGVVTVIIGFFFLYREYPFEVNLNEGYYYVTLYYILCASLFNIGWANVQISFKSLLPSLSINRKSKDLMVRYRTAFRFISQLLCMILSSILFIIITDKFFSFTILKILCIAIGVICSVIYLIWCNEKELTEKIDNHYNEFVKLIDPEKKRIKKINNSQKEFGVVYWLKDPGFISTIFVHLSVHIPMNVTMAMIPYYMESCLGIKKSESGGTPYEISVYFIFCTVGSVVNSFFIQKYIERLNSRLKMMLYAWLFTSIGSLPMMFIPINFNYPIYFFSFILGIGFSLALSCVTNLTNDVVGNRGASNGAFVFSAYGFCDKILVGLAISFVMEYIKDNSYILNLVISIMPVLQMLGGLIIVLFNNSDKIDKNKDGVDMNIDYDKEELLLYNSTLTFETIRS